MTIDTNRPGWTSWDCDFCGEDPEDCYCGEPITDHAFQAVVSAPEDDECTHRLDGTDLTYCGQPREDHDH